MRLKDAKVGDRILIYVLMRPFKCQLLFDKDASNNKIPATVISQDYGTTLAWKDDEQRPDSQGGFDTEVPDDWTAKGFNFAQQYNSACFCEPLVEIQLHSQDGAKKNYGNECPCGIHPSQCSYHKP